MFTVLQPELDYFAPERQLYNQYHRRQTPRKTRQQQRPSRVIKIPIGGNNIETKLLKIRQKNAALKIQRAFREYLHNKSALLQLRVLEDELNALIDTLKQQAMECTLILNEDGSVPLKAETKPFLLYEDSLIKLLIKLDGVQSSKYRQYRKQLIVKLQSELDQVDARKRDELFFDASEDFEIEGECLMNLFS